MEDPEGYAARGRTELVQKRCTVVHRPREGNTFLPQCSRRGRMPRELPATAWCLVRPIQGQVVVASIQLASKSAPTLSGILLAIGGMKFAMRWLMRSQSTEEA